MGRKDKNKVYEKVEEYSTDDKYISLVNVNKIYDNHKHAVYDFNLDIKKEEFIVFVGGSGCGKSTTLRMIAGLEEISSGDLYIDGVRANDLTSKERDISMVFQSYALYPHMSVYDNIAFGLKIRHYPKDEIDEKVRNAAKILQIEEYLNKKPRELSGGQRQRVALGRAIVRKAKVFLMDEPLSNLDAKLRVAMRSEIIKLHKSIGSTTIYVTHDQTEAMTMADRIVVMNEGHVQQIGTPEEIYNEPANIFVATFIGSPAMNMCEAHYNNGKLVFGNGFSIKLTDKEIKTHDEFYQNEIERLKEEIEAYKDEYEIRYEEKEKGLLLKFEIDDLVDSLAEEKKWKEDLLIKYDEIISTHEHDIVFGIRPEDVHLLDEKHDDYSRSNPLEVVVTVAELLGNEYYVHTDFNGKDLIAKIPASKKVKINDNLEFDFNLDKIKIFDPDTTRKIL